MAVLLLNASMQPLNVISRRRLVVLLTRECVAFLSAEDAAAAERAMDERRFPDGVVVVRLLRSIQIPRRALTCNRRNLLIRDDNSCQYCGFAGPVSELTVDHVVPMSRGGALASWDNLVVACRRCNWRKANHLPHEVGLRLRRKPFAPRLEYTHILFLRHPELKAAYDAVCAA
jgi:5-methylcytosine-specific restriction endonuclease McrA